MLHSWYNYLLFTDGQPTSSQYQNTSMAASPDKILTMGIVKDGLNTSPELLSGLEILES